MEANKQEDVAALNKVLGAASKPAPAEHLESWNPMETFPMIRVAKEWTPGMTITGRFVEIKKVASAKFTLSQEKDESGKGVEYIGVFDTVEAAPSRFGIWSTNELYAAFEKLSPGDVISMTYKEKGVNAKGLAQHFFEYKKAAPKAH